MIDLYLRRKKINLESLIEEREYYEPNVKENFKIEKLNSVETEITLLSESIERSEKINALKFKSTNFNNNLIEKNMKHSILKKESKKVTFASKSPSLINLKSQIQPLKVKTKEDHNPHLESILK